MPGLGRQSGIPRASWLAGQAESVSSGFKWETLPQCVRWIIIWKTSEANLVSTCMHAHMCTHIGKHESTHACILHICVYTCKISWTEKGGVYHTLEDSHHLSKPTEVSANWFKNTFMVIFLTCLTKCLEAIGPAKWIHKFIVSSVQVKKMNLREMDWIIPWCISTFYPRTNIWSYIMKGIVIVWIWMVPIGHDDKD